MRQNSRSGSCSGQKLGSGGNWLGETPGSRGGTTEVSWGISEGDDVVSKPPALGRDFRRFLLRLKREIRPARVILFGSRARGDQRALSDYDLLVVSPRFRGVPWVERAPMVYRLWDLPLDLEPICLTPEEFRRRRRELSIIGEAVREGIAV